MTHESIQESISGFIDGELPVSAEVELFAHMASCPECRLFLRDAMRLRDELLAGRTLATPSLRSPDLEPSRTRDRDTENSDLLVLAWQKRVPLPVAASVALLVLLGGILLGGPTADKQYAGNPGATYLSGMTTLSSENSAGVAQHHTVP